MVLRVGIWMACVRIREHPGRALYLAATLAVAVMAWQVLSALASPFVGESAGTGAWVMVLNERDGLSMPLRHAGAVSTVDGVDQVAHLNLATVACRPPSAYATLNAWGGESTSMLLVERGLDPALVRRWAGTPNGVLVGAQLARRCGWEVGMVVEPQGLHDAPVRIEVVGIFNADDALGEQIAYAHYDDVVPQLPEAEQDRAWVIAARAEPDRAAALAERIEAALASSDAPVRASTSADAEAALARFGQVQLILLLVIVAVTLCAALVMVSVSAFAAAERRATMAGLIALGFQREHLLLGSLIEVLAVICAGLVLGLSAGWTVLHWLSPALAHLLGALSTPSWAWRWLGLGLLLLVGLAMVPLLAASLRVRPTDWMRT